MTQYGSQDRIKQKSGIDPADISDVSDESDLNDLIDALNEQASNLVDEYCGREFTLTENATLSVDGSDMNTLRLKREYPIIEIHSITVGDTDLESGEYRIKPSKTLPGRNSGIIERRGAVFPDGWENVEITLDYGFPDPPGEVVAVVEDLVSDQLQEAKRNETADGAQSISMDGFSVSFEDRMRLSPEQKDRLSMFRRVAVA